MSVPNELVNYSFPQAPIMSSPWIPQGHSSSSSAYRYLPPQLSPITPRVQLSPPLAVNDAVSLRSQSMRRRNNSKKISKTYKHIPHKEKPPHLVARRNARERRRVQAVNSAFAMLRKCVPIDNRHKRLSKVKTLHLAINYICSLRAMLDESEDSNLLSNNSMAYSRQENNPSPVDDDFDDEEKNLSGFNEFEEYIESDMETVNKENKSQGWIVNSEYEPNHWFDMSCEDYYPGNSAY